MPVLLIQGSKNFNPEKDTTMTDWVAANAKAARSAKWATTMTKWLIAKNKGRTTWQIVSFCGPNGCESVGIVDLLAIRKDHNLPSKPGLKRGDLLELVLIQVKGGGAAWPSHEELLRLRKVARHYRAKHVVLAAWKKGKQPTFYRMKRTLAKDAHQNDAWVELTAISKVFS